MMITPERTKPLAMPSMMTGDKASFVDNDFSSESSDDFDENKVGMKPKASGEAASIITSSQGSEIITS